MSETFKNNVSTHNNSNGGNNTMSNPFNREHEVITAGTFHTLKGDNTMNNPFGKEHETIEAGTFHTMKGDDMMTDVIFVHKEAGAKKDAVRICKESDIPDFLSDAITVVDNDKLFLQCVEGGEMAPFGSVIGYEKTEKTFSGWNCWVIGNAATNLVEKDGVFYKKATVMKAAQVTADSIPSFLFGADVRHNEDGSWSIKTDWGESKGYPYKAYWILYGRKDDNIPDANILTKTEKSFKDYIVCDENGNDLGWLSELDAIWSSGQEQYITSPDGRKVFVSKKGAKIEE